MRIHVKRLWSLQRTRPGTEAGGHAPFRRISPSRRQSSFSVVVVIVGNKDGLRGAGIVPVARVISVRAPRNRARQEVDMTVYKGQSGRWERGASYDVACGRGLEVEPSPTP